MTTEADQFVVSIKLGDNIDIPITFNQGDIVEDVAYRFCKDHRLSVTYYDKIAQFLRDKLVEVRGNSEERWSRDIEQIEEHLQQELSDEKKIENEFKQEPAITQYYSFGKPEAATPAPEPVTNEAQYYSEQPHRAIQPTVRYKNRNNDVLKYFNGNAENNLSTDRFLVEDLCKSVNDSLDHKLKRLAIAEDRSEDNLERNHGRPTSSDLKARVHDRLYKDAKARAAKKERSSSKPRHNISVGDYQREYVSVTEQIRSKKFADTYTSCKERQRSNSAERGRSNCFSTGKKSSYMTSRHNRAVSHNPQEDCFEIHTVDQIYRPKNSSRGQLKSAHGGQREAINVTPSQINNQSSSRNGSAARPSKKITDIQRCDQLHAMSKLMAERSQARKKLLEERYTFHPTVNQYLSEKTSMSFDERLNTDMRGRQDKSRKREEDLSRENQRRLMHPNTGRHPIVRRVYYSDIENRNCAQQFVWNG